MPGLTDFDKSHITEIEGKPDNLRFDRFFQYTEYPTGYNKMFRMRLKSFPVLTL